MAKEGTLDLDGWKPVLCEYNEMPTEFFEYRLPDGSISIFKKNDSWCARKNSSEHVIDNATYAEADKKIFDDFNIHVPDAEKMLKYGVRVCG